MRNLTESILALFAGRERAAALYGDLLEMSATHSRAWFAVAYLRTLISLGWRTPVALVAAYCVCFNAYRATPAITWLGSRLFHWLPNMGLKYELFFYRSFWVLPMDVMRASLFFLFPLALVRFGLRDRLTRLTFLFLLLFLVDFSRRPIGVAIGEVLTVIMLIAALCLPKWRRPAIVLLAAMIPSYAIFRPLMLPGGVGWSNGAAFATRLLEVPAAAIVCLLLHPWMMGKPEASGSLELARDAHA